MVPQAFCGPSLALLTTCPQGPSVTASSDELSTAESSPLKGLSHKWLHPHKTREPDFPDGHQEAGYVFGGGNPLETILFLRMIYRLRSTSVGKSNRTGIYSLPLVWNDLHMALPEQQKHTYLQLGCYSQLCAVKQPCNFA